MNIEFGDQSLEELYLYGKTNQNTPAVATHPGELIKDELKERKMTQKQLALPRRASKRLC